MQRGRYRWFKFSLALGGLLAILLLVDSIANYVFISRHIVMDQVHRDLSKVSVALERQLHSTPIEDSARLRSVLETVRAEHKLGWIDVRSRDGRSLAHAGLDLAPSFSSMQIDHAMMNHQPLGIMRATPDGPMRVEVFRLHLPPAAQALQPTPASLEMAASLDSAKAVFWPLRQNLIIDCSAALALLLALTVMALRFRSYLEGKQLEHQLDIARQVQQDLLPPAEKKLEHAHYAAQCLPAWGVGGDFYDAFELEGGDLALVLGDVSGKGMPAALLMGVIHGAVRSGDWTESARQHEEASRKLNQLLFERASGSRYASLFWSYYDVASGTLRYINAGHCPPLLVQTRDRRTSVRRLDDGGTVLGLLHGARYYQSSVRVESGDLLLLYSDGVVEAINSAGDEFGEERLIEAIELCPSAEPEELRDRILSAVRRFAAPQPPHDDLSLVAIRFDAPALEKHAASAALQLATTV